jgi:nitroreductase
METWDVIRARRNVREYTDQPIPRDDLERILEAGRRSPSSSNWQPWHFVVVTDRDQLVELAKAWPQGGGHIARSAATIALVAETPADDRTRQRIAYDFGQATAFMMITAADLGIGSGHSAVADQEVAQQVLGFPDGWLCAYMPGFGYPADRPLRPVQKPDRRPFDDVVHWGRW